MPFGSNPNLIGCLMGHMTWQIARSVPVLEIFRHYLGYEGSPGLWHLLLAMLAKMNVTYEGIHWVSGLIAVGTSLLLIFLAPFPLWIRFTLPFTLFLAFQYAVVARNYVLVPILLFTVAIVWRRGSILMALHFSGTLASLVLPSRSPGGGSHLSTCN